MINTKVIVTYSFIINLSQKMEKESFELLMSDDVNFNEFAHQEAYKRLSRKAKAVRIIDVKVLL